MEKRPEEMEPSNGKFGDGLLLPIFAVAAVFLFVVLCFYAYSNVMKNKNGGEVVMLNGDDSSFKVAPQDPGGMQVEYTDKAVFNTVIGTEENTGGEIKVESQEAPVSQEQLAANVDGAAAPVAADAAPAVVNEGETSANVVVPEDAAPSASGEAVIPENTNDDNTKTVTIAEDAAPVMPENKEVSETEEKLKALKAEIAAPKKVELKEQESRVNAEVKKETNKETGETKTIVNFREPPKSMKKTPTSMASSPTSGAFYVQLSAHTSREEADSSWKDAKAKYSAEIGNYSKNISEAEVKGKKYYRLSFGPFSDRGLASTKCGILKAKGKDCIIQKY